VITLARFLIVAALLLTSFTLNGSTHTQQPPAGCELLSQALSDYGKLKIGSARGDIERYFSREGGFQVPASTRYVYSRCEYLHVEIDFELAKPAEIAFSTTDKITKISKLYVEYPSKD
jgi:hypothetical protein